jgi:hypothetical protein
MLTTETTFVNAPGASVRDRTRILRRSPWCKFQSTHAGTITPDSNVGTIIGFFVSLEVVGVLEPEHIMDAFLKLPKCTN